jgi:ketosteroid isomerase-like protein
MRQLQLTSVLILAAASPGAAQGGVEQSLVRMEDEWARAVVRRDPAPLRRLLAEDFLATDAHGQLHDKAQLIAALADPSDTVASAVNEDVQVRVYGSAAVIVGRTVEEGRNKSGPYVRRVRWTDTWVQRAGQWLCVASHTSLIAQP